MALVYYFKSRIRNQCLWYADSFWSLVVFQQGGNDAWQSEVSRAEGKLNNQGFLAKAPEKVVEEERSKLEKAKEMLAKLEARIAEMQSM